MNRIILNRKALSKILYSEDILEDTIVWYKKGDHEKYINRLLWSLEKADASYISEIVYDLLCINNTRSDLTDQLEGESKVLSNIAYIDILIYYIDKLVDDLVFHSNKFTYRGQNITLSVDKIFRTIAKYIFPEIHAIDVDVSIRKEVAELLSTRHISNELQIELENEEKMRILMCTHTENGVSKINKMNDKFCICSLCGAKYQIIN